MLLYRAYTGGTRYYSSADCFLFFLGRLIDRPYHSELHDELVPLLRERVQERVGATNDALSIAMRILTCKKLGLRYDTDMRSLLNLQCVDGSWDVGWIYQYGASGLRIGNRGLTTAFAINAIDGYNNETITGGLSTVSYGRQMLYFLLSVVIVSEGQKLLLVEETNHHLFGF